MSLEILVGPLPGALSEHTMLARYYEFMRNASTARANAQRIREQPLRLADDMPIRLEDTLKEIVEAEAALYDKLATEYEAIASGCRVLAARICDLNERADVFLAEQRIDNENIQRARR